eukprot:1158924-Pelagomonas_calceolata.AAC.4
MCVSSHVPSFVHERSLSAVPGGVGYIACVARTQGRLPCVLTSHTGAAGPRVELLGHMRFALWAAACNPRKQAGFVGRVGCHLALGPVQQMHILGRAGGNVLAVVNDGCVTNWPGVCAGCHFAQKPKDESAWHKDVSGSMLKSSRGNLHGANMSVEARLHGPACKAGAACKTLALCVYLHQPVRMFCALVFGGAGLATLFLLGSTRTLCKAKPSKARQVYCGSSGIEAFRGFALLLSVLNASREVDE